MDFYEEYFDGDDTFFNTVDSAFFKRLYRIRLANDGVSPTVMCDRCRAHKGCNYSGKYDVGRSWKTYRKHQCRHMESRDSIRYVQEPEEAEDLLDEL